MAIEAVIFDWAGTTIDYGNQAPVVALQRTFASFGIEGSNAATQQDLKLDKMSLIHQLLKHDGVRKAALDRFGKISADDIALSLFSAFKRNLLAILPTHAQLKPGVRDLIAYLEANSIPYGTTSGWDADMITDLLPLVAPQGFRPRVNVTVKDTGVDRPDPAMNRLAMAQLGVQHPARTIVFGDTLDDIRAGQAAGANAVGVIEGSGLLGLSKAQWLALPDRDQQALRLQARREYAAAGADLIVNNARDLMRLMQSEASMNQSDAL